MIVLILVSGSIFALRGLLVPLPLDGVAGSVAFPPRRSRRSSTRSPRRRCWRRAAARSAYAGRALRHNGLARTGVARRGGPRRARGARHRRRSDLRSTDLAPTESGYGAVVYLIVIARSLLRRHRRTDGALHARACDRRQAQRRAPRHLRQHDALLALHGRAESRRHSRSCTPSPGSWAEACRRGLSPARRCACSRACSSGRCTFG